MRAHGVSSAGTNSADWIEVELVALVASLVARMGSNQRIGVGSVHE
jgi:hypothetical protein